MTMVQYTTKEIWCRNEDRRIYGVAYIPEAEGRVPLVIFAHELGNNHEAGIRYAERLAESGYAAYTFDFCGGSVVENRSDGDNTHMSLMTEVADLVSVIQSAKAWSFVDPDRIVLLGGSQGGVVSAVTGCRHPEEICGLMLMYPPFMIPDNVRAEYPSRDAVPEEFDLFGGWMRVGRIYGTDVWDLDVYEELSGYQGPVLLLHGDQDRTVDIAISGKAAARIPHCEFFTIPGGRHGFHDSPFEEAVGHILQYMSRYCPV